MSGSLYVVGYIRHVKKLTNLSANILWFIADWAEDTIANIES